MSRTVTICAASLFVFALLFTGCNNSSDPGPSARPDDTKPVTKTAVKDHGHKPGQNGGRLVEIGSDNFHAEVVFATDGVVRVYTLGKDEAIVQEVESQTLTGYVTPDRETEAVEFLLKPVSRPGDAEGKTSQFVGTLPESLRGRPIEVIVPSIRIDGTRYRFAFSNAATTTHAEEMPPKIEDEDERRLYLTAAGKYTEADIKANGRTTASLKFKGMKSDHDDNPQPGDKICPISKTKASAKFTWIIDSKPYEFCCPPCVDEFVKTAKEKPATVKAPGEYVKK